jgi:hypothetical protein
VENQGVPIPVRDPSKLSSEELVAQLQKAGAEGLELRRKLYEVETRGKLDLDRLRAATAAHAQDLAGQNGALVKSLARLQAEVDELKIQNATLRGQLEADRNQKAHVVPVILPQKGVQ